ncbi:MAG: hypothetical protein CM15mL6_250 [uncultured marine virus]|nr:MAG: hypothetical protein CM15mL6_250 [uncultured marine virus]
MITTLPEQDVIEKLDRSDLSFRIMPGHYGDKKEKDRRTKKKVSKGLAALAKKRPKVAAAIMKNKKKSNGY